MRAALDTNILAYAEGVNDDVRRAQARSLIRELRGSEILVPAQALGELFVVLLRRGKRTTDEARTTVLRWAEAYPIIATTPDVLVTALDLAVVHRLALWDSVILSAASSVGCDVLFSEDMGHGFAWRGVTIRNPSTEPLMN